MLKLIEKIGEILIPQEQKALELRELKVQFVRDKRAILHHLKMCKKSNGIVGIYATRLGRGMFLGTITSIYHDVITLRPIEAVDHDAKAIMIPLKEITSICPFNQVYVAAEEVELEAEHHEGLQLAHAQ
jgi:hypothetical protein